MPVDFEEVGAGGTVKGAGGDIGALVSVDPDADLLADLFSSQFDAEPPGKRGPGRPRGSKNRMTSDVVRVAKANYRDQLFTLLDIVAMTPKQLRREWTLKSKDAADLWLKALALSMKYTHQAQPSAVVIAGINFQPVNIDLGLFAEDADSDTDFDLQIKDAMKSVGYAATAQAVAQDEVGHDE